MQKFNKKKLFTIARLTSVGVLGDGGGKTHHGGKKKHTSQYKTGGAVATNDIQYATNQMIKSQSSAIRGKEFDTKYLFFFVLIHLIFLSESSEMLEFGDFLVLNTMFIMKAGM